MPTRWTKRTIDLVLLLPSVGLGGGPDLELTVTATDAAVAHNRWLLGESTANVEELGHWDRRRIHNLKYFTWVEQQGREVSELDRQWHDPSYWAEIQGMTGPIDRLIEGFNAEVAAS